MGYEIQSPNQGDNTGNWSEQHPYADIRQTFRKWMRESLQFRAIWQMRSYSVEAFYRGMHRISYDALSRTIRELPVTTSNQFNIQKLRVIVRGLKNRILRNDPRFHISSFSGDATPKEKAAAEKYLSEKWESLHLKDKMKSLIQHATLKTISWAYVTWDEEKDDLDVTVEDPFNVLTSPDGRMEGPVFVGKYMIRSVRRSLDEIKSNPRYAKGKFAQTVQKLQPERQQANDPWKDQILSYEYRIPLDLSDGGAIIHELYLFDEPEAGAKHPDSPEGVNDKLKRKAKQRRITFVGDYVIDDEWLDEDRFILLGFLMENDGGVLYSQSWAYPLLDMNKALNEGYSNRADWFNKFAKGRLMVKKGTRLSAINNKNGEIIEYDQMQPTQMQSVSLPQTAEVHIQETERYMEDMGGVHSDAMGRASSAYQSGKTTMSIIAADTENQGEPVENLKTFLSELAYRMLLTASRHMALRAGQEDGEGLVGSGVADEAEMAAGRPLSPSIVKIRPIKGVKVEVIPGSAYADLQARADLMEMKAAGVAIPDAMIMEAYKLGSTGELLAQFQEEQAMKAEAQDGQDAVEAKQATLENKKIAAGARIVPQEGENHQIHLAVHGQFLSSVGQDGKVAAAIANHMRQHEALGNPEALMKPAQDRALAEQQNQRRPGSWKVPVDIGTVQDNRVG